MANIQVCKKNYVKKIAKSLFTQNLNHPKKETHFQSKALKWAMVVKLLPALFSKRDAENTILNT